MSIYAAKYSVPVFLAGATLIGCASVPTGRVGVEWTPLRGTVDKPLAEGFHVSLPFGSGVSSRLTRATTGGFLGCVGERTRYQIEKLHSLISRLRREAYTNSSHRRARIPNSTLVAPYVTSSARKVVGRYSPEEIYSTKREQIEREIRDEVSQKLAGKHVQVNAVLIREVHLPPAVQTAIQTKLEERNKRRWRCSSSSSEQSRKPCANTSRRRA